ncbi:MAG: hypothetical protein A3J38_10785 [Gammaproteobacteria bacterium RIFCSPHIGHO2_12_FULL_45_9]|nr:MAG: hypothetical protein A3J38_10785 [Gammaproteobacteria bacterium RIFCSPHIGHO2_12_FULL_45_9]
MLLETGNEDTASQQAALNALLLCNASYLQIGTFLKKMPKNDWPRVIAILTQHAIFSRSMARCDHNQTTRFFLNNVGRHNWGYFFSCLPPEGWTQLFPTRSVLTTLLNYDISKIQPASTQWALLETLRPFVETTITRTHDLQDVFDAISSEHRTPFLNTLNPDVFVRMIHNSTHIDDLLFTTTFLLAHVKAPRQLPWSSVHKQLQHLLDITLQTMPHDHPRHLLHWLKREILRSPLFTLPDDNTQTIETITMRIHSVLQAQTVNTLRDIVRQQTASYGWFDMAANRDPLSRLIQEYDSHFPNLGPRSPLMPYSPINP